MSTHLRHDLERLHESLLSGKLPRNLSWASVVDLIAHIGEVLPSGNDEFVFIVGAHRGSFKKPSEHELGVEEVSRLRRFLKDAVSVPENRALHQPCRMVVVIDHHSAHIYHDLDESLPIETQTARPLDPSHYHHHLVHKKEAHYSGERVPEDPAFYEEVAQLLVPADEIVLIGHGTGKSSAVTYLHDYLQEHHPTVALRVIATEVADLSALTAPEIEAIAKRHMIAMV
jgi:hypothetical protein